MEKVKRQKKTEKPQASISAGYKIGEDRLKRFCRVRIAQELIIKEMLGDAPRDPVGDEVIKAWEDVLAAVRAARPPEPERGEQWHGQV